MFYETVIEVNDRSFYVDKLERLTGIPRSDWSRLTLEHLKEHFERAIKREGRKKVTLSS